MSSSSISSRIQQIRELIGDRQIDFAQRIGSSIGTISNWENGATKPSRSTLRRVAKICGVNEEWLLKGVGEMMESKTHHYEPQAKQNHRQITPLQRVGGKTTGVISKGTTSKAGDVTNVIPGQHRIITINPDEEVQLLPSWAMPIIMAASSIVLTSSDVDRAMKAEKEGRSFRLRVLVEDVERHEEEPEEPPARED